jgi:hypothetical protein
LVTTKTELKAIAPAAMAGLIRALAMVLTPEAQVMPITGMTILLAAIVSGREFTLLQL